ncbi:hypothetical protein [Actinoplanes sp. NPDC051411]|uniref:hypothetical protein n=1 Tax=Actinoplanes sp. NPDC051411 TaxID=3155522 RepID=UPI003426A6E9
MCGTTQPVDTNLLVQVCAVRSKNLENVESAVIVRNNRSGMYGTEVAAALYEEYSGYVLARSTCPNSGVAPNSWSVCFGTVREDGYPVYVGSSGVNGKNTYGSPDV